MSKTVPKPTDDPTKIRLTIICVDSCPEPRRLTFDQNRSRLTQTALMGSNSVQWIRVRADQRLPTCDLTLPPGTESGVDTNPQGPNWTICNELALAISLAVGKRLVIVDGGWPTSFTVGNWLDGSFNNLVQQAEHAETPIAIDHAIPNDISAFFIRQKTPSPLTNLLLFFLAVLARVFFGTKKTVFTPGFVGMETELAKRVLEQAQGFTTVSSPQPSTFTVKETVPVSPLHSSDQLIGLARASGAVTVDIEYRSQTVTAGSSSPISRLQVAKSCWHLIKFWWNQIQFPSRDIGQGVSDTGFEPTKAAGIRAAKQTENGHASAGLRNFNSSDMKWPIQLLGWVALLLASSAVLFSQASYSLFEPDETRNAEISYNLLKSDQWILMTLNDQPYRNKPPGLFWAIATSYQIFGFSAWATRLPSILATLITICAVLGLGQKLVGFRAAWIAAVVLLASCGFAITGRYAVMDACFTACATVCGLSLLLAELTLWRHSLSTRKIGFAGSVRQTCWLLTAGLAAGIGIMIKGPALLVLVLPPVLMAYALAGRLNFFSLPRCLCFLVPMIMVTAPWYLAVALADPEFYTEFLWRHHVLRFTNAFDHEAPWWYYVPMLLAVMFPASYLLPLLGIHLLSSSPQQRCWRTPALGNCLLMSGWVLVFYSVSHSKLPTYILPALPWLALMIGHMLEAKIFSGIDRVEERVNKQPVGFVRLRGLTWLKLQLQSKIAPDAILILPKISPGGFVIISILVVLGVRLQIDTAEAISLTLMIWFWVVMIAMSAMPWLFQRNRKLAWSSLAITAVAMVCTLSQILVPAIAEHKSTVTTVAKLKETDEFRSVPVVFFDEHPYSAELYLHDNQVHYFPVDEAVEFREFIIKHPAGIIVACKDKLDRYCETLQAEVEIQSWAASDEIFISRPRPQVSSATSRHLARSAETSVLNDRR